MRRFPINLVRNRFSRFGGRQGFNKDETLSGFILAGAVTAVAISAHAHGFYVQCENSRKPSDKQNVTDTTQYTARIEEYWKHAKSLHSPSARFHAFASRQTASSNLHQVPAMTFTDFIASFLVPRFRLSDLNPNRVHESEFLGNADGLITFEEYLAIIHLLQIPKIHFDVAFSIFDLDGDDAVDKAEFCHVMENLLRSQQDASSTCTSIDIEKTFTRLIAHLFEDSKSISSTEFENVLDTLRTQLLHEEFEVYATQPLKNHEYSISVHDFAITLIAGCEPHQLKLYLNRLSKLHASKERVNWTEFYNFHFHIQHNLRDIQLALELAGKDEITETDFIRAVAIVCEIELSYPVMQQIFHVFDRNGNGLLDRSELLHMLQLRDSSNFCKAELDSKMQRFWHCLEAK
uniref:Uncharacterized protein AlNc14C40G3424 n=1 Tax=Albugo laibachii Nc14 TaxID=890382 RepID=F0W9G5_9STRA|nr:conserved hypothetical protein [Albugo laibachii Nc14]|eukprot:CCA17779.1 conserved hypothetical protein [Albugo laibachii Nc14]